MKFRHLEYFIAAAEELNFTHAADRLHVSQPPFSKQIHDLEGEREIELFDRRRKGVALTPAGKAFLVDARRLEDCDGKIVASEMPDNFHSALIFGTESAGMIMFCRR
jgi:DNA-binding transcriptional LysR family regulator